MAFMKLLPMVLTERKVERAQRAILQLRRIDPQRGQRGFTLIEIICVLAIIAMLAAIVLPAIPRGTSRPRLEAYAVQTAALLKGDHNAAFRQQREIATLVDAPARVIRSGASGRVVRLPPDVVVEATLAARCNGQASGSSIRYFASGISCGGVIALKRPGSIFQVRVNWLTGEAEVVSLN
jgi:general secretion pathway protein H